MKAASLKESAELAGIAAIVASLIFVGLQVRQDHRIAVAQVLSQYDANLIEMSRLISENREIWVNGLNGEELSKLDEVTFEAIADAVDRLHSNRWSRSLIIDTLPSERVAQRYAFNIYAYPGLRTYFNKKTARRQSFYSAFGQSDNFEFYGMVQNYLTKLDSESPPGADSNTYTLW